MKKKLSIIALFMAVSLMTSCTVATSGVHNDNNKLHVENSEYVGTGKHKPAGGIEVGDDGAISTSMGTMFSDEETSSSNSGNNNKNENTESKPVAPSTDFSDNDETPTESNSSSGSNSSGSGAVSSGSGVPREEGIFYTDFGIRAVKKEPGKYIAQQDYYYTSGKLDKMILTFYPLADFNPDDIGAYTSGGYTIDDAVKQSDGTYYIVNSDETTMSALSMIDMNSMYDMLKYAFEAEKAAN